MVWIDVVTLITLPQPAFSMCGAASRAIWKPPLTLVWTICCQISGLTLQNGGGTRLYVSDTSSIPTPALFTSTSTPPKLSTVLETMSAHCMGSRISAIIAITLPRRPFASVAMSSAICMALVTFAPAPASAKTITRPSPRPPPVTMQVVPARSMGFIDCLRRIVWLQLQLRKRHRRIHPIEAPPATPITAVLASGNCHPRDTRRQEKDYR